MCVARILIAKRYNAHARLVDLHCERDRFTHSRCKPRTASGIKIGCIVVVR